VLLLAIAVDLEVPRRAPPSCGARARTPSPPWTGEVPVRADACSREDEGRAEEEDEGKRDISLCPMDSKMTGSLQKLTEWYFSERNDSFSGILHNGDLSMVFFKNGDLLML